MALSPKENNEPPTQRHGLFFCLLGRKMGYSQLQPKGWWLHCCEMQSFWSGTVFVLVGAHGCVEVQSPRCSSALSTQSSENWLIVPPNFPWRQAWAQPWFRVPAHPVCPGSGVSLQCGWLCRKGPELHDLNHTSVPRQRGDLEMSEKVPCGETELIHIAVQLSLEHTMRCRLPLRFTNWVTQSLPSPPLSHGWPARKTDQSLTVLQ